MSNGFDVGHEIFEHEQHEYTKTIMCSIKEDRRNRTAALAGKYVVTTQHPSQHHLLFYQDKRISSKGYWTRFLSNALGYDSYDHAILKASSFRYGNSRIAYVNDTGFFKLID